MLKRFKTLFLNFWCLASPLQFPWWFGGDTRSFCKDFDTTSGVLLMTQLQQLWNIRLYSVNSVMFCYMNLSRHVMTLYSEHASFSRLQMVFRWATSTPILSASLWGLWLHCDACRNFVPPKRLPRQHRSRWAKRTTVSKPEERHSWDRAKQILKQHCMCTTSVQFLERPTSIPCSAGDGLCILCLLPSYSD